MSAKQKRHFCVCVCAHVCFRTYNISVLEGWMGWQGQGVGSERQDLSVCIWGPCGVTSAPVHMNVCNYVHECTVSCVRACGVAQCCSRGHYVRSYKRVAVRNSRTSSWYGAPEVRDVTNRLSDGSNSWQLQDYNGHVVRCYLHPLFPFIHLCRDTAWCIIACASYYIPERRSVL